LWPELSALDSLIASQQPGRMKNSSGCCRITTEDTANRARFFTVRSAFQNSL